MKESHIEGVATHDDPESCGCISQGSSRSVDRGTRGLGIEPRNQQLRGADAVNRGGRPHDRAQERESPVDPARSETPCTRGNFLDRNWEILGVPAEDGPAGRIGKAEGRTPMMHAPRKSDGPIIPGKSPNKGAPASAEAMEGRGPTKGNASQQTTLRTQSRAGVPQELERVREAATRDRKARFTSLYHHLTLERLGVAYHALERKAAAGTDGVTWAQYGEHLKDNLQDLHARLHRGAYRAKPSRRVLIPKADGRHRPLGIASLEDKIVQRAVAEVLNAIYEVDFLGFSYGFRRGRNQHMALDALAVGIQRKRVNWVLDADIRDFYGTIDHGWLMKFLEHRIADRRMLRLIHKWLKAGILQEGIWSETEEGVPQGATISCLLANVYLHYTFDLWTRQWRQRYTRGEMIVVRYADDVALGFEREQEARQYWTELTERLSRFGLALNEDKTRLLRFGTFAAQQRRKQGEGKPETFGFLGLTHICGLSRAGKFLLVRHTIAKRQRAKLQQLSREMLRRRHRPIPELGAWLGSVVRGYAAYHAVPTNGRRVGAFRREVIRSWHRALKRRSQRSRTNWKRMSTLAHRWIPPNRILHPWPRERFDARTRGKSPVR
jgi:RNA-directed DNA polymerase